MGNCYTFPRYLALDWHRESDRFECQVGDANVEAEVRHDVEVNERRGRARAAVLGPCPASRYSFLRFVYMGCGSLASYRNASAIESKAAKARKPMFARASA